MSITLMGKKKLRVGWIWLSMMVAMLLLAAGCGPSQTVKQQASVEPAAAGEPAGTEQAGEVASSQNRLITGIQINETPEAYEVAISANHSLDYTLAEPPFQQAKVLYFPDAALDMETNEFELPGNNVIGKVEAIELVTGGPSKVVIPLLQPEPDFEVRRLSENDLNIVFPKAVPVEPESAGVTEEEITAEPMEESQSPAEAAVQARPEKPAPLATMVKSVDVQKKENRVDIKVVANGSVKVFKSFALPSPPRIVLDLDGIHSDHQKEQRLDVDSDIVKQVRHFSHPDYLRLVLDVNPDYLSKYDAVSVRDGLLVSVGDTSAVAEVMPDEEADKEVVKETAVVEEAGAAEAEASATAATAVSAAAAAPAAGEGETADEAMIMAETENEAADAPAAEADEKTAAPAEEPLKEGAASEQDAAEETVAPAPETATAESEIGQYDRPALVNAIDFIEEPEGRSTIKIGTTHPVNYDLVKRADKKLRLKLDNTNILSFRQRPLITTRFNSAVDLIMPIQTEKMKDAEKTYVDIQMREDVSYDIERQDSALLVHFSPSSVPPDPAKEVVIPTVHPMGDEEPAEAGEVAAEEPTTTAEPAEEVTEPAMPVEEEVAEAPDAEEPAVEAAPAEAEATMAAAAREAQDADVTEIFGAKKKKEYTGEPIALDFYKTDIRNVIRIIRDVSGKNFAIDKDVSGSVTLSFVNPVPWDQVLDLILEMNDLGMVKNDGILRIATKDTIRRQKEAAKAELAAEQELKKTEEQLEPLITEYFSISYSDAGADVLPHLEDLLTERGHAKVDARTNQIIMTDIASNVEKAKEIIEKIDRVTPQVMIKARVVETSTDFSREFGFEWGSGGSYGVHNRPGGNTAPPTFNPNQPGTYSSDLGGFYGYNVAFNNPAGFATNSLGIDFSRIVGTPFSLDARLSLMETKGEIKIISSPRIVTLDNKQATISQGQEIPYTTVDDGEADTEFKDALLQLQVTPHVTPDNRISMKIYIEETELGEAQIAGQEPPLNTKNAETELLVNDGDTIVIGGIIQQTDREGMGGVPYLSKIPLLGHLFKNTSRSSEKTELLIFITPTVVRLD